MAFRDRSGLIYPALTDTMPGENPSTGEQTSRPRFPRVAAIHVAGEERSHCSAPGALI
jgi:hypothetical protein